MLPKKYTEGVQTYHRILCHLSSTHHKWEVQNRYVLNIDIASLLVFLPDFVQVVYSLFSLVPNPASSSTLLIFCDTSNLKYSVFPDLFPLNLHVQKSYLYQTRHILIMVLEQLLFRMSILFFPSGSADMLTFRRRIKSRLPFAGIIRRLPYSTRFQDKG